MTPKFGWKKDARDERDYLHKPVMALPDRVDMMEFAPSVRDQGNLGSCTGFGIGGNLTLTAKRLNVGTEWFSPTWIYNGGRLIGGTLGEDSGSYPRDNLKFIQTYGCLLEHFRPYRDTLDTSDPTTWPVASEALKWPVLTYTRVTDGVDYICSALAEGHAVALGSPWFGSWMNVPASGALPADFTSTVGGHETFLYGYDRIANVFYGQNSWGDGWGRGGRFTMPFTAIAAFKARDGYDAHYITVEWTVIPPEPPDPGEHKCWLIEFFRRLFS